MDNFTERAYYINSIQRSNSPEINKMNGDQSVSPVLSRNKKYYRPAKRDSRVSLEKKRFGSSPVQDENIGSDNRASPVPTITTKVDVAQIIETSPGKSVPEFNVSSKFKSDIFSKIYEGFKTATGKNLTVTESKAKHHATKIFGDILNATPVPTEQNLLNKSDSALKRSFLTKVNVASSSNPPPTLERKEACGDRNQSDQDQYFSVKIKTAAKDLSLTSEELSKCFENDVFSQLPSKEFCRINRATEVYSNTNYNEHSSDTETAISDNNFAAGKKSFDINEISDSELVYLADTAEYLSAQGSGQKSQPTNKSPKKTMKNEENRKDITGRLSLELNDPSNLQIEDLQKRSTSKDHSRHQSLTPKVDIHKYHNKSKLKQETSKNIVDPSISPSVLNTHHPNMANNVYELHKNSRFVNESEHYIRDKSKPPDNSILTNIMRMLGVIKTSPNGFSKEEVGISQEVFDRHSRVLEAVVHTMQADEQLVQKKHLKKVKQHTKQKSPKTSQKEKETTKRKLEDRCISPDVVETKDVCPAISQEIKRSKIVEKRISNSVGEGTSSNATGNDIKISEKSMLIERALTDSLPHEDLQESQIKDSLAKVQGEEEFSSDQAKSSNALPVTNKKLQIEIGGTNIKININSSNLNEHIGFKSASGRDINITPTAIEAAKNMYKSVERVMEMSTIPEETTLEEDKPIKNYCSFDCPPSDTDSVSTVNDYVKQTITDYKLSDRDAKDLVKYKGTAVPVILGFSSASGNKINVSAKSMKIAQEMYKEAIENDKEIKYDLLSSPERDGSDVKQVAVMFSLASEGCKINDVLNNFDGKLKHEPVEATKVETINDQMKSRKHLFDDICFDDLDDLNNELNFNCPPNANFASCFSTAGGRSIKVSEGNLQAATKLFEDQDQLTLNSETSLRSAQELIGDAVSSMDTALNKLSSSIKPRNLKMSAYKKRLGMTSAKCKPITVSMQSIEKAKSFFDDTEDLEDIDPELGAFPLRTTSPNRTNVSRPKETYNLNTNPCYNSNSSVVGNTRMNMNLSRLPLKINGNTSSVKLSTSSSETNKDISPTRLKQINNFKSEPVSSRNSSPLTRRKPINISTPAKEEHQQSLSFLNLNLTPIKPNFLPRTINNRNNLSTIQESSSVLLMEQSSSDLSQIKAEFDEEVETLKRKLNILNDRKSALDLQESIMSTSTDDYKRPKPGILYLLKQRSNRVPLKDLQLCSQENIEYFNVDTTILDFEFSIADQVHFNIAMESGATVKTKDGALIVPSVNDSIGLTEIIRGFQTMPGVDPDLIPKNWIANHFKMIVWKLVSYERVFPHYFKNSLCLENVLQQLKYRYDREIDRAERPALRKITEMDDAPQKRMVLCVCTIHKIAKDNCYELDLTDGWYIIRTTIDQPLCEQVSVGKIRTGTKLMIQNAELLHCETGNHPLQLPNHVRLRININATRRSPWHCKLGYQKDTRAFPVRISTTHPDGGQIAYVKVYINRVYPIRYLEHDNTVKVWRNNKAEQRRAQDFEREKCSCVEIIQEKVMQDYQFKPKAKNLKVSNAELAAITCSEHLHDLLESSNDPESFVERLSTSQRTDLMSYMQNSNVRRQEEVLAKVAQEVNAQKTMDRNVTAVLRLLVTDTLENSTDGVILSIWRPTEDILDSLAEDCVISAYNVVPNKVRKELSSTSRTYFKVDERDCQKNNRQIVPIAMTIDSYYRPVFNEMDTVGLVVQTQVEKHRQELWLCDFQARLLLVQIHDGPKYCCLLDNVTRGECVAVLNVLVHKPHKGYGQCVANQLSVVSTFPQIISYRENLETFRQRLPKDVNQLLNDCDIKIEKYRLSAEICNKSDNFLSSKLAMHTSFDDYVDEEAFNSSGLTAADIALSMLQIDHE